MRSEMKVWMVLYRILKGRINCLKINVIPKKDWFKDGACDQFNISERYLWPHFGHTGQEHTVFDSYSNCKHPAKVNSTGNMFNSVQCWWFHLRFLTCRFYPILFDFSVCSTMQTAFSSWVLVDRQIGAAMTYEQVTLTLLGFSVHVFY